MFISFFFLPSLLFFFSGDAVGGGVGVGGGGMWRGREDVDEEAPSYLFLLSHFSFVSLLLWLLSLFGFCCCCCFVLSSSSSFIAYLRSGNCACVVFYLPACLHKPISPVVRFVVIRSLQC